MNTWARQTWRARQTTEVPWWKRSALPSGDHVTHLNARPTGRPIVPQTTAAPKRSHWENSVHEEEEDKEWKQESSAGAQSAGIAKIS